MHPRDQEQADSEPRSTPEAPKSPRRTRCLPEGPAPNASLLERCQQKDPEEIRDGEHERWGNSQPRQHTPPSAPPPIGIAGTLLQDPTVFGII